jgi:hypothetical protein
MIQGMPKDELPAEITDNLESGKSGLYNGSEHIDSLKVHKVVIGYDIQKYNKIQEEIEDLLTKEDGVFMQLKKALKIEKLT